jgi:hypothetical protein
MRGGVEGVGCWSVQSSDAGFTPELSALAAAIVASIDPDQRAHRATIFAPDFCTEKNVLAEADGFVA